MTVMLKRVDGIPVVCCLVTWVFFFTGMHSAVPVLGK
jgi:hypothetical protein